MASPIMPFYQRLNPEIQTGTGGVLTGRADAFDILCGASDGNLNDTPCSGAGALTASIAAQSHHGRKRLPKLKDFQEQHDFNFEKNFSSGRLGKFL